MLHRIGIGVWLGFLVAIGTWSSVEAQERVKIAYSSADASNVVWFTALDVVSS